METTLIISILSLLSSLGTSLFVLLKDCLPSHPKNCKSTCCNSSSLDIE